MARPSTCGEFEEACNSLMIAVSPQARGKIGNEETEKVIDEKCILPVYFFPAFTVSPVARPSTYDEFEEARNSLMIAVSPQARGKSGNEETEKVIGEMYSSRVF